MATVTPSGIGIDLVQVDWFRGQELLVFEHFLSRVLGDEEKKYCRTFIDPAPHFAGIFAAKEAVIKAWHSAGRTESLEYHQISITHGSSGQPIASIHTSFVVQVKISITHTDSIAVAMSWLTLL